MYIWVKPQSTGDYVIAFDPPTDHPEDWLEMTTRAMHYMEISKELLKQVKVYEAQKDLRAAKVARDLAETLTKKSKVN
jgi:hypothetical protein